MPQSSSAPDMLHILQKNLQNEGKERFERASSLYTALTGRQFFHSEDPALDLFMLLVVAQMISNEDHKKGIFDAVQTVIKKELKENEEKKEGIPFFVLFLLIVSVLNFIILCFYVFKTLY